MSKRPMMLAILSATILLRCSTTPSTPGPQSSSSPVQAVPCPADPTFVFHAPKDGTADEIAWTKGAMPAAQAALYDRPDTVGKIRAHNAAVISVCGGHK